MINAQRADASESTSAVIEASYDALITLVQGSCNDSNPSLQKMLTGILFSLEQTIVNASVNNEIVQTYLCGLVQVIMSRIGDLVDTETGVKIQKLIIMIFEQHQRVTEFGLTAYQGLCSGLKERIDINLFGKYIFAALEQDEDEDVTRLAIGVVGDLSLALGDQIEAYLSSLIPHLLNVLRN